MSVEKQAFIQLSAVASEEAAVARSAQYIQQNFARFLRKNERVLICFPKRDNAACRILEEAVLACECTPVWMGEDRRWVAMMKTAFTSKCNCIIGPPLMLLGMSKLARQMGTPLYARNVLLSGYPATSWIIEAVEKGLDCQSWGCYDPGIGPVIAGFSCTNRIGVHIREEEYDVQIVDREGKELADGEIGYVRISHRLHPDLQVLTGDTGRIDRTPCSCGCASPRLVDLDSDKEGYSGLSAEGERLHYWSSVLDCRLGRTEHGVELEAVVFQGEKLPKFPSCAKMEIRPWNPDTDVPFDHHDVVKYMLLTGQNH